MTDAALHEDTIDGVTTFWFPSGRPTLRASLLFRAGMVDETLATSGWLHLLEHLALHGDNPSDLEVNGSVSLLYTSLDMHGPPDKVVVALNRAAARLHSIDAAELAHELGILRAEAAIRSEGAIQQALIWRYGARGPGLAAYADSALSRADVARLTERARTYFTKGNAVLCLDGPPPPGLQFALPEGAPVPPPPMVECDQTVPAAYPHGSSNVLAQSVVARSAEATAYVRILQRRLVTRLRSELGTSYAPVGSYEQLDADTAWISVGADCSREALVDSVAAFLDEIRDLAETGPSAEEVSDDIAGTIQGYRDPYAAPAQAWLAGRDRLLGKPVASLHELTKEAEQVSPEMVREAAAEASARLLLGIPGYMLRSDIDLPVLDSPDDPALTGGTRYRQPVWGDHKQQFTVAGSTLQWTSGERNMTMPLTEVAACWAWPDGARRLIRDDGYQVMIEPVFWRHGDRLVADVDAAVVEDRVVPKPERAFDERPMPPSGLKRLGLTVARTPATIIRALPGDADTLALILAGLTAGLVLAVIVTFVLRGLQSPMPIALGVLVYLVYVGVKKAKGG